MMDVSTATRSATSALKVLEQLLGIQALEADLVHLGEQRVAIEPAAPGEEEVDLLGRDGALQLLAVEQLGLELGERLARADERLGALAVPATERRRATGVRKRSLVSAWKRRVGEECDGGRRT